MQPIRVLKQDDRLGREPDTPSVPGQQRRADRPGQRGYLLGDRRWRQVQGCGGSRDRAPLSEFSQRAELNEINREEILHDSFHNF